MKVNRKMNKLLKKKLFDFQILANKSRCQTVKRVELMVDTYTIRMDKIPT